MIDINDLQIEKILKKIDPEKVKPPIQEPAENEKVLGKLDERGIKLFGAWIKMKQKNDKETNEIYLRIYNRERKDFTNKEQAQILIRKQTTEIMKQLFWIHVQEITDYPSKKMALRKDFQIVLLPRY